MNIEEVLSEYDRVEATHDFDAINEFLTRNIDLARAEKDTGSLITLYNEALGFYRETTSFEQGVNTCRDLMVLMQEMGIQDTIPYATSLLNVATTCRSLGLIKESLVYYNEVLRIYTEKLEPNDMAFAPLYNNMALLFEEMEDYESAVDVLKKALALVMSDPDSQIRVAISHTNLAMCLLKAGSYDEAMFNLNAAFDIFDALPEVDYHYGAALSAMGEAKFVVGDYEESADYYERALSEVYKNTGHSHAYEVTLSNLKQASAKALEAKNIQAIANGEVVEQIKGLDLSRAYYEEYGKSMIHDKFPEYEGRIAVGLVGEGSECYGFDDSTSLDHDFGPGFSMWVSDEVYEEIGIELQKAYDELPVRYRGITRLSTVEAGQRVGVFKIGDWYVRMLGIPGTPLTINDWLFITDEQFSKVTNGSVFRDDEGIFSGIRNEIMKYYPENVWVRKLAQEASLFSQYGQYNYSRMSARKDMVAASVCLGSFIEHAMRLTYLCHKTYAPFYKWMHRGLKDIDEFVSTRLEAIASHLDDVESNVAIIDELGTYFAGEFKRMGLSSIESNYLDHHTRSIISTGSRGVG